jgi:predicted PilT family ATPase
MSQRVDDLTELQQQVDLARQTEYGITSQSHFRAMALLTGDDANNAKIANAKGAFLENLGKVEAISSGEKEKFFDDLRETSDQLRVSGEKVLTLYEAGRIEEALALHMADEHAISHLLEPATRELVADASAEAAAASDAFDSNKGFLRTMVLSISSASLALAVLLGFVLSLAFIRPVR